MPYLIDKDGIESLRHIRERLSSNNMIAAREASALGDMIFAIMARLEEVADDDVSENDSDEVLATNLPAETAFLVSREKATKIMGGLVPGGASHDLIMQAACAMMAYEGQRMVAQALEADSIMGGVALDDGTLDDLIAATAEQADGR